MKQTLQLLGAWAFIVFMILLFALCGCHTVRKSQTSNTITTDSASIRKKQSVTQTHVDTSKQKTVQVSAGDSVIVDLVIDTTHPQKQYTVTFDKKTRTVTSNQPIRKASFKSDEGIQFSNFTGGVSDSLIKKDMTDSAHVNRNSDNQQITTEKKGTSFSFSLIWIFAIVLVIYLVLKQMGVL